MASNAVEQKDIDLVGQRTLGSFQRTWEFERRKEGPWRRPSTHFAFGLCGCKLGQAMLTCQPWWAILDRWEESWNRLLGLWLYFLHCRWLPRTLHCSSAECIGRHVKSDTETERFWGKSGVRSHPLSPIFAAPWSVDRTQLVILQNSCPFFVTRKGQGLCLLPWIVQNFQQKWACLEEHRDSLEADMGQPLGK